MAEFDAEGWYPAGKGKRAPVVEFAGAKELRRTLKKAGIDLEDLKKAMLEAANIVEQNAMFLAPRDTGNLALTLRSSAAKSSARVKAGDKAAPYAGPIHWGWPAHNIKPNPFISLAATDSESQWVGVFAEYVNDTLNQIKGI